MFPKMLTKYAFFVRCCSQLRVYDFKNRQFGITTMCFADYRRHTPVMFSDWIKCLLVCALVTASNAMSYADKLTCNDDTVFVANEPRTCYCNLDGNVWWKSSKDQMPIHNKELRIIPTREMLHKKWVCVQEGAQLQVHFVMKRVYYGPRELLMTIEKQKTRNTTFQLKERTLVNVHCEATDVNPGAYFRFRQESGRPMKAEPKIARGKLKSTISFHPKESGKLYCEAVNSKVTKFKSSTYINIEIIPEHETASLFFQYLATRLSVILVLCAILAGIFEVHRVQHPRDPALEVFEIEYEKIVNQVAMHREQQRMTQGKVRLSCDYGYPKRYSVEVSDFTTINFDVVKHNAALNETFKQLTSSLFLTKRRSKSRFQRVSAMRNKSVKESTKTEPSSSENQTEPSSTGYNVDPVDMCLPTIMSSESTPDISPCLPDSRETKELQRKCNVLLNTLKFACDSHEKEVISKALKEYETNKADYESQSNFDITVIQRCYHVLEVLKLKEEMKKASELDDPNLIRDAIQDAEQSEYADDLVIEIQEVSKLYQALTRTELLRKNLLTSLDPLVIVQVKNSDPVPEEIHDVLVATFLTLGEAERRVREWSDCKNLCNYEVLTKRLQMFRFKKLRVQVSQRCLEILEPYDQAEVSEVNYAVGQLYSFTKEISDMKLIVNERKLRTLFAEQQKSLEMDDYTPCTSRENSLVTANQTQDNKAEKTSRKRRRGSALDGQIRPVPSKDRLSVSGLSLAIAKSGSRVPSSKKSLLSEKSDHEGHTKTKTKKVKGKSKATKHRT